MVCKGTGAFHRRLRTVAHRPHPRFHTVLGYLDDAIIVPLGVLLVIRMIPPNVMAEKRFEAAAAIDRPVSRTAAAVIVALWIAAVALAAWGGYRYFSAR